jgi:hypothetical protein
VGLLDVDRLPSLCTPPKCGLPAWAITPAAGSAGCYGKRFLWQRIYREVLPGFAGMHKLTRQYRITTLRRNVKAYLRRRGYKSGDRHSCIHVVSRITKMP